MSYLVHDGGVPPAVLRRLLLQLEGQGADGARAADLASLGRAHAAGKDVQGLEIGEKNIQILFLFGGKVWDLLTL